MEKKIGSKLPNIPSQRMTITALQNNNMYIKQSIFKSYPHTHLFINTHS